MARRPQDYDAAPIQARAMRVVEQEKLSACEIGKRMGVNAERVRYLLGLRKNNGYYCRSMSSGVAARLLRALHIDPVDVDI